MNLCCKVLTMSMTAALFVTASMLLAISDGSSTSKQEAVVALPFASDVQKDGDWNVTGTETYKDEVITLNGNLTVSGKLVLDNTTLTIITSVQDTKWVQVRTGGSLRMSNGSVVRGLDHARYHFRADPSSSVRMNRSRVMDCGTDSGVLAQRGLYSRTTDLNLDGSAVLGGRTGIIVDGGSAVVNGSMITNMDGNGLEVLNGGHVTMNGSSVTFCGGSALEIVSSSANVTGSTIRDCQSVLMANTSTVILERSIFSARSMKAIGAVSSWLFIGDCAPSLPGNDRLLLDMPFWGPSKAELLNTTLTQLDVMDPTGTITEAYRKDFVVLTNNGKRADQAEVEVRDKHHRLEFHGITPPSGELLDVNVVSHITNSTGRHSMDLHHLWVRLEGATRTRTFSSTTDHVFNMTVLLSDPEVLIDAPLNGTHLPYRDLTVEGRVIDIRPVSVLSYILDGQNEVVLPTRSTFSFPLTLDDGPHDIQVIAMNDDGRFGTSRVHFITDTKAPVISLLNPLNNSVVNVSTVLFAGSCEPEVRLFIGQDLVPHPQSTFRHYMNLKEGLNIITIEAWDLAGNGITRKVNVISDTTPPFIAVADPPIGHRTKETSLTVKGSTSADTVGLTVNGYQAQLADGTFKAVVSDLTEGPNTILLSAVDRVGWTTQKELMVWVDMTAPGLVIRSLPQFTNRRDLELNGMVDEESVVTVNGLEAMVIEGSFSARVELYQGTNAILVRATDLVGNTAERTVQVVLDLEAPVIERVQPPSGSSVKGQFLEIKGEAFDENGVSSVSGRHAGGAYESVSGLESWSWLVELSPGSNRFEVRAEDRAGNVRTMPLQYTLETSGAVDSTPPVVTIIEPKMNASLTSGTVWVKGTATDNVGVASVQMRVTGGDWQTVEGRFRWSLNVTLTQGHKIIEVRAFDASGNMGTDMVKVLVTVPADGPEQENEGGPKLWMYVVLVLLLLLFTAMAVYLMYRRKVLMDEVDGKPEDRRSPPGRPVGPSGPRLTERSIGRSDRRGRTGPSRERAAGRASSEPSKRSRPPN